MSDETQPQTVPLARLEKVVEARRALEAKVKELEAQVSELKPLADSVQEVTASLEAERKARADDAARFKARESFVRLGLEDEDAMEIIRQRWEALPKKDRPDLADFAKEDKIASALLPKPEKTDDAAPAEAAQEPETKPEPRATATNKDTEPTPPAGAEWTVEEYNRQISEAIDRNDIARAKEIQRQWLS